ncbi:Uncharacterized protein Fot_21780 [Forsythia ovata]|uniref:Uncharacterized protein n=1 Tax=Forsythia ovata TaxID=205694 RepID=A0ABD1UVU1_9LAMI
MDTNTDVTTSSGLWKILPSQHLQEMYKPSTTSLVPPAEKVKTKGQPFIEEAYTNFSNYFAIVGQQEVITALRSKRSNLDLSSIEAKFPQMDIEDPPDNSGLKRL